MDDDEIVIPEELPREKGHNALFSESVAKIGKIHRIIVHSRIQIFEKCSVTGPNQSEIDTDYGRKFGLDEIDWWVNKNENNLEELLKKSKAIQTSVETLRQVSKKIREEHHFMEYDELIEKIKNFVDSHDSEISILLNYVEWLEQKGEDAPAILFSYSVWGSSSRFHRYPSTVIRSIEDDNSPNQYYAEIALGFAITGGYQIGVICTDMYTEAYDSSESGTPVFINKKKLFSRTEYGIVHDFEEYFKNIRDSVDRIIPEIEKKLEVQSTIFNDSFLKQVISKILPPNIVENNLWDFKETLDFWHVTKPEIKKDKQFEFAEHIVSYANSNGGIIVVGVGNLSRKIVGISNLENKIQSLRTTIEKFIDHDDGFVFLHPIILEDDNNQEQLCLVILIKQTHQPIAAISKTGMSSFSIRQNTGKKRSTLTELNPLKKTIYRDNFDFVANLEDIIS